MKKTTQYVIFELATSGNRSIKCYPVIVNGTLTQWTDRASAPRFSRKEAVNAALTSMANLRAKGYNPIFRIAPATGGPEITFQ